MEICDWSTPTVMSSMTSITNCFSSSKGMGWILDDSSNKNDTSPLSHAANREMFGWNDLTSDFIGWDGWMTSQIDVCDVIYDPVDNVMTSRCHELRHVMRKRTLSQHMQSMTSYRLHDVIYHRNVNFPVMPWLSMLVSMKRDTDWPGWTGSLTPRSDGTPCTSSHTGAWKVDVWEWSLSADETGSDHKCFHFGRVKRAQKMSKISQFPMLYNPQKRSLLRIVQHRKLRYFGHLIRENDKQRRLLEGKVEGKRRRGRQRVTWMKNVKELCQMDYCGCVRAAVDRTRWRIMTAHNLNLEDGTNDWFETSTDSRHRHRQYRVLKRW